jgi:hypothetical protein
MSIAYHGNYVGPGWSAGAYQSSVDSDVPALDAFDASGKVHDALYANGGDLAAADLQFAATNASTLDPKRWVAGGLVGLQGLARYSGLLSRFKEGPTDKISKSSALLSTTMPKTKQPKNLPQLASLTRKEAKNLRRVIADQDKTNYLAIKPNLKQKARYLEPLKPSLSVASAPVSIGTTVRASKPVVTQMSNGVLVQGREFLCQVYETNNSSFQLAASAPLHPSYYVASIMGQMARVYQKYKFRKCAIHFVTRQPTSVTGEIALVYNSQVTEPAENGANANFLPRVMTRGDAILGPLWQNHSITIPCDNTFRLIDPFVSPDVAAHIFGEIQAYTLSGVTDTAGYLLIDYELEFNTTMFAPHSTSIPITTGPGAQYSCVDTTSSNTAGNAVNLANTTMSSLPNGTVWKCYMNADESTVGTGTTLANAWKTTNQYALTTTTVGTADITFSITDGQVFYAVVVGSALYCYVSISAAIAGDSAGQIFYRTTASTAATWLVNSYVVQLGLVIEMQTQ